MRFPFLKCSNFYFFINAKKIYLKDQIDLYCEYSPAKKDVLCKGCEHVSNKNSNCDCDGEGYIHMITKK